MNIKKLMELGAVEEIEKKNWNTSRGYLFNEAIDAFSKFQIYWEKVFDEFKLNNLIKDIITNEIEKAKSNYELPEVIGNIPEIISKALLQNLNKCVRDKK